MRFLEKSKVRRLMSREKMIDFALSKLGRAGYSMAYPARLGPRFYDCSSFVYYSLIAGGFLPKGSVIGNTEGLYKLKGSVLMEIYSYEDIRPGDIFIRGMEGASNGAAGHTGIFLKKDKIIHCSYRENGVNIAGKNSGLSRFLDRRRSSYERYFRPVSAPKKNYKVIEKVGMAFIRVATNVRAAPNTRAAIVALYYPGSALYYDRLVENEGYLWASYIGRDTGKRRYVALERR